MDSCFFCSNHPAEASCTIEQPVYILNRYTHLGIARRFEYNKIVVPVQRCAACMQEHRKTDKARKRSIGIGAATGFVVGVVIPGAFLFTAIIGGFLGHVIAGNRAKKRYKQKNIYGLSTADLSNHPFIRQKLDAGWTLKKPAGL